MFSLKYTVGLGSTTLLVPSEEYANEYLDLLALRGTILEVELVELENYKPSKRVVYATTRSWE